MRKSAKEQRIQDYMDEQIQTQTTQRRRIKMWFANRLTDNLQNRMRKDSNIEQKQLEIKNRITEASKGVLQIRNIQKISESWYDQNCDTVREFQRRIEKWINVQPYQAKK